MYFIKHLFDVLVRVNQPDFLKKLRTDRLTGK